MKRSFLILTALVIVLVMTFILQRNPGVEAGIFQSRVGEAFQRDGYRIVSVGPRNPESIPLPLAIQWGPQGWHSSGAMKFASGFPAGADCYTVTRDGVLKLDCCVRYLDGRASIIDIQGSALQRSAASILRSTLADQFPGLPIRLTTQ